MLLTLPLYLDSDPRQDERPRGFGACHDTHTTLGPWLAREANTAESSRGVCQQERPQTVGGDDQNTGSDARYVSVTPLIASDEFLSDM